MIARAASVYFLLGSPGSGRRALVRDLVENGLAPDERVLVLVASTEADNDAGRALATRPNVEVRAWSWDGKLLPGTAIAPATTVFFLAEGQGDPVTQLEQLKPWLAQHHAELARILTVVDCQLAERRPELALWFDACIHFSDVVLLTKREGVANKWLSAFIRRYEDQFLQLKKTGLPNHALVLEPQPRRVSQYFDEGDELPPVEIEGDDDEEEENEDATPPEPYFERNRSGRRVKEVPDIRAYL
jgi:hypothetical protein